MVNTNSNTSKTILGIDPGTNLLGYGIIECVNQNIKLITIGELKLSKLEDHGKKLHAIHSRISELIAGFNVTEVSIEAPFYGKNVQSMLKLGRAQGVAIAAAISQGIEVFEYEPKKVKQSITGSGSATKLQVSAMLETILNTKIAFNTLDASDGLSVAICHHFQFNPKKFGTPKNAASGWKSYIQNNPDKLK